MMTKRKVVKKRKLSKGEKAYIEAAQPVNTLGMWYDPNKFPKNKEQFLSILAQETRRVGSEQFMQGRSQEAQSLKMQYERALQQARVEGLKEVTELAKQMSKMAYMLMMTLNGGKPFSGG